MTRTFIGDFETTVYSGQKTTEVWASAIVEMGSEDVLIHSSIEETWNFLKRLNCNVVVYYHNLKFDGHFWLWYFLSRNELKQATFEVGENIRFFDDKNLENNTFKYSISDMGQWYSISVKIKGHVITFKDSLKLLPFSVAEIGKGFKTKHQKLEMQYEGERYSGCTITKEEREYIKNDVLVVKEAMEELFSQGMNRATIGSCCMSEFKMILQDDFETLFPNLGAIELDKRIYGVSNVDEYIRNSYHGGWCYVVPEKANKVYKNGSTCDVNSLYPSMMLKESGNKYPYALPTFFRGTIPEKAKKPNRYYFVRFKCRFYLKKNMLPTVQIKHSLLYKGNEWLSTSDYYDKDSNTYSRYYMDVDGLQDTSVTMTMTCTDFELFQKHYNIVDLEILDGCYFFAMEGIFDEYINKWAEVKKNNKGAKRTTAKLMLNNLYGKLATSSDSSYKVAHLEDGIIKFKSYHANDKKLIYVACGSAITSYARNFTITLAQKNYYGPNKRGFIYADTDSLHCDLSPSELVDIKTHPTNFNCWSIESEWKEGIFVRQKTYIEIINKSDGEPCNETPVIKCAGMGKRCKELLKVSMGYGETTPEDESERLFLLKKRKITDFGLGICIPGRLTPKRIVGGVLLTKGEYQMK